MIKTGNYDAVGGGIGVAFRGYNIFIFWLKVFCAIDKTTRNRWCIAQFYLDTGYRNYTSYQYQIALSAGLRAIEKHVE